MTDAENVLMNKVFFDPDEVIELLDPKEKDMTENEAVFNKVHPVVRELTRNHAKWQVSDKVGDRIYVLYADSDEEFALAIPKFDATIEKRRAERAGNNTLQQPTHDTLTSFCKCHPEVQTTQGFSKKTNKPYWYHDSNEGRCFGSGYQTRTR